ncbi:ABC transporter ATP-binding protein [Methanobrevibacter woesei]|uniref:ABC transporter ATP-binding protein n=1 Tax=Methanobrevibacter woesei TaxID=190976 RepID=UPI00235330FA|nr:ATP-binding cassette domain-containing protein [Methanobrevibacter woesei]
MDTIVSINDIYKKFDKDNVLNGITVNIPKGSICGLVGPNGAGKTTLLRIIASLQKPNSGQVNVNTDVFSALIEQPALFYELNAVDNINQQLILYGLEKECDPMDFLKYVGLEDTKKKKVKNFSLGMKQKLAIAMMLVGNPELIILDEPMNGLDPQGIINLRNLILKLNNDGVTFLISSHLLYELEKIATDFIFINHGEIISKMTIDEFLEMNKGYIQLEVNDIDLLKKAMEDLKIPFVEVDDSKMNIYTNYTITDLIIKLNSYGCIVRRCFNVENTLEDFFIGLMRENDE